MFGINDHEVDGPSGAWIAEVVQAARRGSIAARRAGAAWATARRKISTSMFNPRWRQIIGGGDAFGWIGKIFAWFQSSSILGSKRLFPICVLRRKTRFGSPAMLKCQEIGITGITVKSIRR